jgi:hypothetical protein
VVLLFGDPAAAKSKKVSGLMSYVLCLILMDSLWRFKLGLCLQPPAWFEGNLNRLGAGAFEITPRVFLFESLKE